MTMERAIWALPANCAPSLGRPGGERCPHCGYWHLREGYCQALNAKPLVALVETLSRPDETLTETLSPPEMADETLNEASETLTACAECGKRFTSARATARYCSSACRLKAHRRGSVGVEENSDEA